MTRPLLLYLHFFLNLFYKVSDINYTATRKHVKNFFGDHYIPMYFEAPNSVFMLDKHNNEQTSDVNFNIKRDNVSSI